MKNRFVFFGSLLNLVTLVAGLLIGFFFGTSYSGRVHAQGNPQVQEIQPGVMTGTFGAGLVLAHDIQSDSLVVNGYDLLKLHQNTLNYLGKQIGANSIAIQELIDNSKATKLYTIKPAAPSPAPTPANPPERKP